MKKFLTAVLIFSTIFAKAQNSVIFCAQTNCPITITAPVDSALLFGVATITGAKDTVVSYLWKQVSGPAAILATPGSSQTMARKLVPGSYIFSMTVTTKLGATQTVASDQLTVLPAPPLPRTVKSVTFLFVNGVWIPSFVFNDGTIQ